MDDSPQPAGREPADAPHAVPVDPPVVPLRLLLQPGGEPVELDSPDVIAGRHSDAGLRLSLPDVSRHHCRFRFTGEAWQVTDLESLNGTIVNGRRIDRATLAPRDVIQIGGYVFEVDLPRRLAS